MTPEQIVTLRAACFADPTAAAFFPPRDNVGLCTYLNQNSAFIVWRSTTSAPDIMDAINWANFTPSDVPTGDAAALQREYRCQGKQLNLQILLQGREVLPTGRANIRAGLSDALLNVPAGTGGAMLDAGWLGAGKVKAAISRAANRAEAVFASGTGTAGTPGNLGSWEGGVTQERADNLMFKPDGSTWTAGG